MSHPIIICSSFPRKRESRDPTLHRLPWTPAFAGVTIRVGLSGYALDGSLLPVDLLHDFCPPVDKRQHRTRRLRREHRHHACDAHLGESLHLVEILAEA